MFNDRFTYIDSIDLSTVNSAGPNSEIVKMTNMVRRFSVLTKKASLEEVYQCVTDHSDPEIALILASAKSPDGEFRFQSQEEVKQFMFGGGTYESITRNLFVEGIRRISACFAAAELIHAFAQLPQHDEHAENLKNRATAELERILATPELKDTTTKATSNEDEATSVRFYFEIKSFEAVSPLKMQIYVPGSISWNDVAVYQGTVSTSNLCADLADKVNEIALNKQGLNVLAAPILSSGAGAVSNLHSIDFFIREPVVGVSAELISVRFVDPANENLNRVPFKWGVDFKFIKDEVLNSLLLIASRTHFLKPTGTALEKLDSFVPVYLYFRKNPLANVIDPLDNKLIFRVSTLSDPVEVELDLTVPLLERHSAAGLALLNGLDQNKKDSKVLGSIIRNDPPTITSDESRWCVIELIAWSVANPESAVTVDILKVPADIEITLGDYKGIYSQFSNKPRSLRVEPKLFNGSSVAPVDSDKQNTGLHRVITLNQSRLLNILRDGAEAYETTLRKQYNKNSYV